MFTPSVNEQSRKTPGTALIIAGAHGVGKDTLALQVSKRLDVARVVRHITRPPTDKEVNGMDYHFVGDADFDNLANRGAFIEHAAYIGSKSGTSFDELMAKLDQADFASLTANFEDGHKIHRLLGETGLRSVCFFVSPCSQQDIEKGPDQYLTVLRARLIDRGRASDLIDGRLLRAAQYREMYLKDPGDSVYVDNSDGRMSQASEYVARVALEHADLPVEC